ncbi:MAG: hypothetical protein ACJ735_07415 [Actinomycetes bacterium]
MARAIVRWSVNGEKSNQTGNEVTELLSVFGTKLGTGAWEVDGLELRPLFELLRRVMDKLANPPGGGSLDHVWIYADSSDAAR